MLELRPGCECCDRDRGLPGLTTARVLRVDAFSAQPGMGNPAGVLLGVAARLGARPNSTSWR